MGYSSEIMMNDFAPRKDDYCTMPRIGTWEINYDVCNGYFKASVNNDILLAPHYKIIATNAMQVDPSYHFRLLDVSTRNCFATFQHGNAFFHFDYFDLMNEDETTTFVFEDVTLFTKKEKWDGQMHKFTTPHTCGKLSLSQYNGALKGCLSSYPLMWCWLVSGQTFEDIVRDPDLLDSDSYHESNPTFPITTEHGDVLVMLPMGWVLMRPSQQQCDDMLNRIQSQRFETKTVDGIDEKIDAVKAALQAEILTQREAETKTSKFNQQIDHTIDESFRRLRVTRTRSHLTRLYQGWSYNYFLSDKFIEGSTLILETFEERKKNQIILIEGSHTLTSSSDTNPSRLGATGVLQCQIVSR